MTSSSAPAAALPAAVARFSALRHPDYRRYFARTMLSQIADNIEHVISYWVMFQAFHSATLAGFAVISHWIPYLLFSVYTGALADRYDCRKLIQISQGLFMLASLAWAVLFATGSLQVWHAAMILLVHGAAGVLGAPAVQLMIHDIVGVDSLPSAIRLTATGRYLAILLGPAVGGAMMLLLGPAGGLFANVLVYLPLTVYLTRIRQTGHTRDPARVRRTPKFGWAETRRLLAEAAKEPRMLSMIMLGGITSFLVGNAFQAQMPAYAHHLGTDEAGTWYSMLLAANAAGAVIGALSLEASRRVRPGTRAAIFCAIVWGVLMACFPAAHTYPVAVVLLVLAGVFNIAFTSMAQTIIQLLAPPPLRGSMVGLFNSAILGLRAGSGVTVGVLGGVIGVQWSLALSSLAVVLVGLALLVADVRGRPAVEPVA